MRNQKPDVLAYIEDTHEAISRLDREHDARSTTLERSASRLTGIVGRPSSLLLIAVGVLCWMAGNIMAAVFGLRPIDPPPFEYLQVASSVSALAVTILILATQRQEDGLANRREHLALQLSALSEQKSAKIISLLEEIRRDSPTLANRDDLQASAMAEASGPQSVLDAIEDYRKRDFE